MTIQEIKDTAEKLSIARREISTQEDLHERSIFPLKQERDRLQAELLSALSSEGLKSIKTETGDNYSRSERKGIEIVDTEKATAWAIENNAVTIDKKLAQQILKDAQLPDFFKETVTEFISIRNNK